MRQDQPNSAGPSTILSYQVIQQEGEVGTSGRSERVYSRGIDTFHPDECEVVVYLAIRE